MATTNNPQNNQQGRQAKNLQQNKRSKTVGFILIAFFLVLLIAAVVLPIVFKVSDASVLVIFGLLLSVMGVILSCFQAFPELKDHLGSVPLPTISRLTAIMSLLLIASIGFNVFQFTRLANNVGLTPAPSSSPSQTLTSTVNGTSPSSGGIGATNRSRLIPLNQNPVLDDTLSNANTDYQWDTGKAGGATCFFAQGSFHIKAPASTGGGCLTEAASTNFTNFVYQIRMTILSGLDKGQGGVGPIFRGDNNLYGGSGYGISFDTNGVWTFGYSKGNLGTVLSGGTNRYFVTGLNEPNYITIRAVGNRIEGTINNQDLFNITDSTLKKGIIGVQIGTGSDGGAEVAFNDAKVWQLS